MNRENVQTLVTHLRSLPDNKVDMAYWFSHGGEGLSLRSLPQWDPHACGSAACLAGWAVALFANKREMGMLADPDNLLDPSVVAEKYLELGSGGPYVQGGTYGRLDITDVTREDVIEYLEDRLAEG